MKRFIDFIKNWGGFIALCLIDIALITLFILSECRCDSAFLRILTGFATLPLAGVGIVGAVFTALSVPRNEQG